MSNNRRRRTARLRAEATAIERRLERAVVPNMTGPVLGRANIAYELSARTKGTAHGGIGAIPLLALARSASSTTSTGTSTSSSGTSPRMRATTS